MGYAFPITYLLGKMHKESRAGGEQRPHLPGETLTIRLGQAFTPLLRESVACFL